MAVRAFRETYVDPALGDIDISDFVGRDARALRYELFWGYYMSNVYRQDVHKFTRQYMSRYGMYKFTREIYNPAFALGSFYRRYLWGGSLDLEAGDGKNKKSALPIITEQKQLRGAISQLWRDSGWRTKRLLVPMFGAILGDVFIRIVDDTVRKKVYLEIVNPNRLYDVVKDPFGNVKEYEIRYQREDDIHDTKTVEYRETATRDGDNVHFQLFKDDAPYPWHFESDNWEEPYGFMPLIHVQHIDIGLEYGVSELNPRLPLFREVDDQGSKLNDQIRKITDPQLLISGTTQAPETSAIRPTAEKGKPEKERTAQKTLWTKNTNVGVHPLLAPLDLGGTIQNIQMMLEKLEHDYPELSLYRVREISGELSGRAVRLLQREATSKVEEYRDTYDDALVRAHQMAIAIGGMRKYPGYDGFSLDSFSAGALAHTIGDRPVFASDPLDIEEIFAAQFANQSAARAAGWPLELLLRMQNFDETKIAQITNSPEYTQLEQENAEEQEPEFGE